MAAYGVLMYVSMIFQAVFISYSVDAAPVVSYHHGAQNHEELQSLAKKALCSSMFLPLPCFVPQSCWQNRCL